MKRFNFSYVGTSKIIFQFFHPFKFLGFGFGIARVDALEYVDPDLNDIYRSWIILK
jgi:hypothetical protein